MPEGVASGLTRKKHRASGESALGVGRGAAGVLAADPAAPIGRLPAGRQAGPATARVRGEDTLRRLGLETALDTASRHAALGRLRSAGALRRWVNTDHRAVAKLIELCSDEDEFDRARIAAGLEPRSAKRQLRVSLCGVAYVARKAGVVRFARRGCKDRVCPHCGRARRQRFTAKLRRVIEGKASGEYGLGHSRLWFVTLTARKLPDENPKTALDRRLAAFRRFRHLGRRWLLGGVRSLEVTARRKGFVLRRAGRSPYRVRVGGVHAHLHTILEVRVGTSPGDVWRAWFEANGSDLSETDPDAFDLQELDDDNVYQVGSYCLDMSGLLDFADVAPEYCGSVLRALHGRRLVAPFGSWRAYDLGLREPPGTIEYGSRTVEGLVKNPTGIFTWASGETEPAERVLAELLLNIGDGRPLGDDLEIEIDASPRGPP